MKLTKREIVILLNGLCTLQDWHHSTNPAAPKATDFVDFEEAYKVVMEEQDNDPMMTFAEIGLLFSKLVFMAQTDLTPEQERLLMMPQSEYLQ